MYKKKACYMQIKISWTNINIIFSSKVKSFKYPHNSSLTSLGHLAQAATFPGFAIKCSFTLVIPTFVTLPQKLHMQLFPCPQVQYFHPGSVLGGFDDPSFAIQWFLKTQNNKKVGYKRDDIDKEEGGVSNKRKKKKLPVKKQRHWTKKKAGKFS